MNIDSYVKVFKMKDVVSDEYFAAKLVAEVCGAPKDKIMEYNYQEINYLASYILSTIPQDKEAPFVDRFELDGVKYGFFPKWQDLSFAEFVDMDTIANKTGDDQLNMMHILMAIMYRPITEERGEHDFDIEKYDVKTINKRAELFKMKMNVNIVLGAMFFFIKYARKYSAYIQSSSIQKIGMMTKVKILWKMRRYLLKAVFRRRSAGTLSSTELLEMILPSMTTSLKKE
jgi:hypothetical protein